VSDHDLSNAQPSCVEGGGFGGVRVGVLDILAGDGRVDERDNTTESSGGGKSGVGAYGWDADDEGVEVLLSCDETASSGDGCIAGSELRDDEISLGELAARVRGGEEELDGGSCKGGSLSGLSEVGQGPDGRDGSIALLLAETVDGISLFFEL
jgi:hypothetical protein